ncbi:hypothetical protein SUGI_0920530 [Cryptomeria japonica]|nr:hypothetical protein SUGI_0920530 [Cryptomeria japonica]
MKKGRCARQGIRFNPEGRCKSYSDGHLDKQRNVNWKVFDVDWDENIISEHEEPWEDTIPQSWSPNFYPTQLVIYDKPIWIRLYNLPSEYWSNPSLERIGRTLGTLLEIDEAIIDIDLYTYARLKIAAVKEIPASISIVTKEGRWVQHVEIEKDITPCTRCGSRLHTIERCGMFVKKAFKKPPIKPNKLWNQKPLGNSEMLLLNGPESNNINLHLKDLSQENIIPSKVPISNNTPTHVPSDHSSPPPAPNQDDIKEDMLSMEGFESSWPNDDTKNLDDLDILDPRCISQFTNALLGRTKGSKGHRSHKTIREQRAHERGIVSVSDYLKVSKGGKPSLEER